MNDSQLLQAAARAAGYEVRWHDAWKCFAHDRPHNITNPPTLAGQRDVWVPLDDDGDALRLAVTLRISLDMLTHIVDATTGTVMCHEPWGDDHNAATRRAIVRAAAAMAPSAG